LILHVTPLAGSANGQEMQKCKPLP